MTLASLFLLALILLLAWSAGFLLVELLLRESAAEGSEATPTQEPDPRWDAALALGLPVGLLVGAFPGWLLTGLSRVPVSGVILPAYFLTLAGVTALLFPFRARRPDSNGPLLFRFAPAAVFLGVTAAYLFLRIGVSEIRQTEKPMDFAVLSALLTTSSLPLQDPWFAGERFPYYHFGTYVAALPARAAGLSPEFAYNLIAAAIAGLAASAGFAAVRARGGARVYATFGALLLIFGGTLDGLRQFLAGAPLSGVDPWPSSRRVLDTITEWPLFTLWLGDLHPHAMALPMLIALAALAGRVGRGPLALGLSIPGVLLDAALLAALLSANPWDLPAALLLVAGGNLLARGFAQAVVRSVLTVLVAVPLLLPFLRSPRPEFLGLRGVTLKTTSPEAFLHFGALLVVPAMALVLALKRSQKRPDEAHVCATFFPALGVAIAIVSERPVLGLGVGFLLGVLYLETRRLETRGPAPAYERADAGGLRSGLFFASVGVALVLVTELLAVKDSYGESLQRMNTVFKCFSGAAPVFALATGLLGSWLTSLSGPSKALLAIPVALLLGTLPHPIALAMRAFHDRNQPEIEARGLDGIAWLSRGDRGAVEWLRKNAGPDDVLVEAHGSAYSEHTRIGGATGRPIVLGWTNHEGLWRDAAGDAEMARREDEVRQVYQSQDEARVFEILKRHRVKYVVVGPLERKQFGEAPFPLGGLSALFERVYDDSGTALYRVRDGSRTGS